MAQFNAAAFGAGLSRARIASEKRDLERQQFETTKQLGTRKLDILQERLDFDKQQAKAAAKAALDKQAQQQARVIFDVTAESIQKAAEVGTLPKLVGSRHFRANLDRLRQMDDRAGTNFVQQLQLTIDAMASPEQQGQAEGQRTLGAAQAQANALGGTPDERRQNLEQLLGLGKEGTDSFFRAVDRLRTTTDPAERSLIEKRIQSLLAEKGFSIELGSDGSIRIQQGGQQQGGTASMLTGARLTDEKAEFDSLTNSIDIIDELLGIAEKDPAKFGIMGSVRRGAQDVVGVLSDVAGLAEKATGIDVASMARSVAKPFEGDEQIANLFDPDLPKITLLENTLALQLAKLRLTSGKGDVRALKAAFDQAKDDVQLSGMTSSQAVVARLKEVRKMFVAAKADLRGRVFGQQDSSQQNAPSGAPSAAPRQAQKFRIENGKLVPVR